MNNSIESIWKNGFLKEDALVAPKLNDLYNQKSIHIIDQFKERYKTNLKMLVIFSFFVLLISFPIGMQYMGVPMFFIFMSLVVYSQQHLKSINDIDKTESSYNYLRAFDDWMNERIALFSKIYRYVYPLIFLSVVFGFWFLDLRDAYLGEVIVKQLVEFFPNLSLINGIPIIGIIGVLLSMVGISYFGERLYISDLRLVYGSLLDKLARLIQDMELLRKA